MVATLSQLQPVSQALNPPHLIAHLEREGNDDLTGRSHLPEVSRGHLQSVTRKAQHRQEGPEVSAPALTKTLLVTRLPHGLQQAIEVDLARLTQRHIAAVGELTGVRKTLPALAFIG